MQLPPTCDTAPRSNNYHEAQRIVYFASVEGALQTTPFFFFFFRDNSSKFCNLMQTSTKVHHKSDQYTSPRIYKKFSKNPPEQNSHAHISSLHRYFEYESCIHRFFDAGRYTRIPDGCLDHLSHLPTNDTILRRFNRGIDHYSPGCPQSQMVFLSGNL